MDKDKLLELVEAIATYSEAEDVDMDVANGRKVTKREIRLAKSLGDIYMFVHANRGRCKHPGWEREATKVYCEFLKNGCF